MKNFSPATDLAIEAAESLTAEAKAADGIKVTKEDCMLPDTAVTLVKITTDKGAEAMEKPKGSYITIESPYMKLDDKDAHRRIAELLKKYLLKLDVLTDAKTVLVAGLGNRRITADALGPQTSGRITVTRHIMDSMPRDIRSVSAVSPGVMGITGIETLDIIKGITEHIRPDLVIAVDSLAARRADRVNSTIQIADTGVSPGAGVGNRRPSLDKKTLGVPVVAIGVPTVVDAATLVNDTLDIMLDDIRTHDSAFFDTLKTLGSEEKYDLIRRILDPYTENMIVTPKEVDEVIEPLSYIIGSALNAVLNPTLELEGL